MHMGLPWRPRPWALTHQEPTPPLQNGLTPLHVAAHYDHQEVAVLLLERGASPHATAKVRSGLWDPGPGRGWSPGVEWPASPCE